MKSMKKILALCFSILILASSISVTSVSAAVPVSVQRVYWNAMVNTALGQLGKTYSQDADKRLGPNYFDCSGLAWYCYSNNGHSLTSGTAADQCQQMVNDGRTVSYIEKSYLSFYDQNDTPNYRYLDIDHVSIYAGNGMMIDASSSHNAVVSRSYSLMFGDIVKKGVLKLACKSNL